MGSMYYGKSNHAIEKALTGGRPRTAVEIAMQAGLSVDTVTKRLIAMRNRGEVYVSEWKRDQPNARAYLRPAYLLGKGKDKDKPKPLTSAEKQRRSRRKVKTSWVSYSGRLG